MVTRNSGKKPDGVPVVEGPPPRLLRPRGVCFRCHFPTPASCVCPTTTTIEVKVKIPSLVSPETTINSTSPTTVRKKRHGLESNDAVQSRSKSPPSRRQLFKDSYSSFDAPGIELNTSVSNEGQAFSESADTSSMSSDSENSCESMSSHMEEDAAIPSTSSEPVAATSTEETSFKPKRKKRKLKPSGRHVCPVCSKMFGSPGKLNQHMFSHTGEKPFECDKCLKAFSSKFKLVRHLLIHSDERQYRCPMCDRTFHRKDHLKNHLKVHSPVKKTYRCDKVGCLKVYSSLLSYRKHAAVHAAEEGDLECKMCGKNFACKDEIVYHLKVHAGSRTVKNPSDKKYKCDYCERKFFTRKDVRRHLVVHTGKRDFLCQFCPHRFGRKDHLVRHIKKSHSNVSSNVRPGTSKGKRSRQITSAETSTSSSSTPRPKTVLRTHGRPKAAMSLESTSETGSVVYQESDNQYISGVLSEITTDIKSKQVDSDLARKVHEMISSHDGDVSFHVDHVKVEDCHLLPELQPIIFSSPVSHPPFEHIPVDNINVPTDQVDGAIKSEESLSVGMDMNQFISGYLVPTSVPSTEANGVEGQPTDEPPVPSQPPPSTGMSDAEATEFLAHFSNDEEILQLMELSIPSASTSSSTGDINTPATTLGPLPRFQQAFQQQPP
ncbi:zinc finger protein PLAG1-like [Frankliniella occidentalis]|uniref:Zinc finger protein PLAG1-like n=1 Tax=Frankliniella occidentalis TaxID=133901 RepID=A0A6J1S4E5_FRAOC|nr:zinc finger protein PLAG1-like [Frankliniella occidentalis]